MVPFVNEKLPNEPIILNTTYEDWRMDLHLEEGSAQVIAMLDAADAPLYYISDLSRVKFSLDDLIKVANIESRGSRALLAHPMLKEFLVVTSIRLVEVAARGLRSNIFGNINVNVFGTVEDALEYARSQ